MRPSVKLVQGYHLTATDKQVILEGFELLKDGTDWERRVQRPRSPKRFRLTPDPVVPHRYLVTVEVNERSMRGEMEVCRRCHLVDLMGVALPGAEPPPEQLDLF